MANDSFQNVLFDLLRASYDEQRTTNEEYAEQLIVVHQEFVNRNKELSDLLKNYIEREKGRSKVNSICKTIMFIVFIILFIALSATIIIIFCKTDFNSTDINGVISLVSVAVTYLTSILSIVKIMSKYLFPLNEEKDTIEMIKTVISNDIEIEKMMSMAIEKSKHCDTEEIVKYKELLDQNIITQEEFATLKKRILKI